MNIRDLLRRSIVRNGDFRLVAPALVEDFERLVGHVHIRAVGVQVDDAFIAQRDRPGIGELRGGRGGFQQCGGGNVKRIGGWRSG